MFKIHRYLFIGLIALMIFSSAQGDLLISRSIIIFDDVLQSKEDVTVINDDPENKLFVQVKAFRVDAPGATDEQLVSIDGDPDPTFIATPTKLIVEPGGTSLVRLLNLQTPDQTEFVYRINFLPIAKPIELEDNPNNETISPNIQILIAYQVLAIVLPLDPQPVVEMARNGKIAVFTNSGNANYLLAAGQQCSPLDENECHELPSKRIYPGNSWKLELTYDGPFSYETRTHEGNRPNYYQ